MVVVQRQTHLFHIVLALSSASGFASLLYRWEQQSNQYGDDRNHHQEFDQRKCTTLRSHNNFPAQRNNKPEEQPQPRWH